VCEQKGKDETNGVERRYLTGAFAQRCADDRSGLGGLQGLRSYGLHADAEKYYREVLRCD
jgi:hypothetical protein